MRRTNCTCSRMMIPFVLYATRLSLRRFDFFCFFSVMKLRCTSLLKRAALNFAASWWSQKLTSLRGTGASTRPPLTIFRSLHTFQLGQHCTQRCDRQPQIRRRCVPPKHRRPIMTLSLLNQAALISPVFMSSQRLTALRGTASSVFLFLAMRHSLFTLQNPVQNGR